MLATTTTFNKYKQKPVETTPKTRWRLHVVKIRILICSIFVKVGYNFTLLLYVY